jgi:hypothetical protein
MNDCLIRIHLATAEDWVPVLEKIRQQLSPASSEHLTLLFWNGFLSESQQTEAARLEDFRKLERLLLRCPVLLITTGSTERLFSCPRTRLGPLCHAPHPIGSQRRWYRCCRIHGCGWIQSAGANGDRVWGTNSFYHLHRAGMWS